MSETELHDISKGSSSKDQSEAAIGKNTPKVKEGKGRRNYPTRF